ncbi:MAG TPA: hypothetical protein VGW33_02525 [Terriglobia bacterium]|nr:hypothetical protein [Terriglobia bacterium]
MTRFSPRHVYLIPLMFLTPGLMAATKNPECTVGPTTAASYTWNFSNETSQLLQKLQAKALTVRDEAAHLQAVGRDNPDLTGWQPHAAILNRARDNVNDMDRILCRLRTIKRVDPSWQQREIARITPTTLELTDYTQAAIAFLGQHEDDLWSPDYRGDVRGIYQRASKLTNSLGNFEEYTADRQDMQRLGRELHVRSSS